MCNHEPADRRMNVLLFAGYLRRAMALTDPEQLALLSQQISDTATVGNAAVERLLPVASQQDLNFNLGIAELLADWAYAQRAVNHRKP